MKRTLLFLLLFGASLAFVLWLERRAEREDGVGQDPVATAEPATPEAGEETGAGDDPSLLSTPTAQEGEEGLRNQEERTEPDVAAGSVESTTTPSTGAGDADPSTPTTTSQIRPGARFEMRGYSEGDANAAPVRFEVTATNSRLADANTWELDGVRAQLFDPEDRARQVLVDAEKGFANIAEGAGPTDFQLEELTLRTVEALVERGAPITPLNVETADASFPIEDRHLLAPGEAVLTGPGLNAQGSDMLVELLRSTFAFRAGGRITIDRPEGERASLESDGTLRAYRDASAVGGGSPLRAPLYLEASGGSRILLEGARPADLSGDEVLMRADEADTGEGFVVRSLDMVGNVRWETQGVAMQAASVKSQLDPDGTFTQARFEGLPTAELVIATDPNVVGETNLPDETRLRIAGEERMDVRNQGGRIEVDIEGPATIAGSGVDLRAGGGLSAFADDLGDPNGTRGFRARGGVVLEGERSTLESAELDVTLLGSSSTAEGAPGATDLRAEARGGARLSGTIRPREEGGAPTAFTLSTPDRLVAERIGTNWRIVEATNVVLTLVDTEGPTGAGGTLEARADRLRDLDLEAAQFVAEGNVAFSGPRGTGRGERLRFLDRDHALLEGSTEERARFENEAGWIEAQTIDFDGTTLVADGRMTAEFRPANVLELTEEQSQALGGSELLALSADRARVTRESLDSWAGGLRLSAEGNVDARLRDATRESVIRAHVLTVEASAVREETVADEDGGTRTQTTRDVVLRAEGAPDTADGPGEPVRSVLREERGTLRLDARRLSVERSGSVQSLVAEDDVRYAAAFGPNLEGRAHRFELSGDGRGRILPVEGERLAVNGAFADGEVPFELTARELLLEDETLVAPDPEIVLRPIKDGQPVEIRAEGRTLRGGRTTFELQDRVSIGGSTDNDQPWRLTGDRIWFEGSVGRRNEPGSLSSLRAEGNVHFELEGAANAFGDSLSGSPLGEMRLEGKPARIESPLFRLEAEWVDFDPDLQIVVGTGPGTILPNQLPPGPDGEVTPVANWRLNYLASRTLVEPDALVLVLQEPVLDYPEEAALFRSTWAALWLDRRRWMKLPGQLKDDAPAPPAVVEPAPQTADGQGIPNVFDLIRFNQISGYLNEVYFEGPIELTQQDDLVMRAGAFYLDTVAGHGWIAEATVNVIGRLLGRPDFGKMIVRTDWLRYSEDGSLQADSATVTPCDHAEPHLRIVTGDLRLTPVANQEAFELSMRDNRIELYDLVRIPLPPIAIGTDENYEPLWQTLRFADSARFGTFVSAGIVRPAGGVGKAVNNLFRGNPFDYDASYKVDASLLGSRGVLLDLGLETESAEDYWLDMYVGGLPDRGEDRGYIRVDEDDRDDLRLWYRADGRWKFDEKSRLDLNLTYQTDPGVQSEFFESDFVRYERDESYLRFTRAWNATFVDATIAPNLENFRSQIEELPSLHLYGGRRPVAEVAGRNLLYTGEAEAAYLSRRAGAFESTDGSLQSPFSNAPEIASEGTFADGFGDRELLRLDTQHRLELPLDVGETGVRATPFLGTRLTAWDEGVERSEEPLRWRAEAGLRLATTFWKPTANGVHQIAPFIEARGELAMEEDGGEVVPFDGVEQPIEGNFVDVGLRTRLDLGGLDSILDVEVYNTWADDVADGQEDGWLPTSVFARLEFEPFGRPFELWHDGRHDLSDGETTYSLLGIATRWSDDLKLQAAHHRGRTLDGERFFEAATVRGLYRWTDKWEFEGRQTFSLLENDDLNTDVIVRRYGHDIVVEFESSVRAGEGTSFSVSIKPRFGFRPTRIGYLSY